MTGTSQNNVFTPNILKCVQINLRDLKCASSSLSQFMTENRIDVALLQEPYAVKAVSPVVYDTS